MVHMFHLDRFLKDRRVGYFKRRAIMRKARKMAEDSVLPFWRVSELIGEEPADALGHLIVTDSAYIQLSCIAIQFRQSALRFVGISTWVMLIMTFVAFAAALVASYFGHTALSVYLLASSFGFAGVFAWLSIRLVILKTRTG
jgi:hypothetical protein